ncbi:hypothetical protein AALC17_17660 [Oscillospiraceae bacterium 38-13]
MDWKRIGGRAALVLVLLGIFMELRYPCDELVFTSRDTEKILRRTPEVSITEEDRAFMAELLAVPSVRALVESGEDGYVSASEDPEVRSAAAGFLGEEGAGDLNAGAMFSEGRQVVYLSWMGPGEEIYCLQEGPEAGAYYKLYSPKRGRTYENWDNQRAQKGEVRRRWFAWLRDGLWREE